MTGHDIPVLETRRLILRGPEAQDSPDFKATFSSYCSRFMGGPLNGYEASMLYAAEIDHWAIRSYGMWMIQDRATGRTLGMAGGWFPARWPEREIAWIIWPGEAGRDYALEATHAVRRHLFGAGGWEGAVSYIDPRNLDRIRLAERPGCTRNKDAPTIDGNDAVHRHPSPERLGPGQLADGIELAISHYSDPLFKSKGLRVD